MVLNYLSDIIRVHRKIWENRVFETKGGTSNFAVASQSDARTGRASERENIESREDVTEDTVLPPDNWQAATVAPIATAIT